MGAGAGARTEILFVCSGLNVGGTERQLVAIALALVRLGWRISVYSLAGSGPLRAELERGGVTVVLPPVNRPLDDASRLRRSVALALAVPHLAFSMLKRRPAIVHFLLPEAYLVGAPIAGLARIPVKVMSRRSLDLYQTNSFIRRFELWLHRSMSAILGNSLSVIGELRGEGVPSRRLGLIYNGIDLNAFARSDAGQAQRKALGIAPDAFVMCIVANLIAYKGHRDLLDALGRAAPDLPPSWHLLVVGRDDGIGAQLQDQAERLGIRKNISFLGSRSDVPSLLAASDLALLCSHQEGFANAILEGMAAGLPMIVTDVGGNAEAVVDGQTGLVVPAHRPDQLADAIVRLAKDPAKRKAFGAAAYRRVSEHFGMERCVAVHDELYRQLLAGGVPADVAQIAPLKPVDLSPALPPRFEHEHAP
jgi:glycosyltransferase involved in cell wall biosynthesis